MPHQCFQCFDFFCAASPSKTCLQKNKVFNQVKGKQKIEVPGNLAIFNPLPHNPDFKNLWKRKLLKTL